MIRVFIIRSRQLFLLILSVSLFSCRSSCFDVLRISFVFYSDGTNVCYCCFSYCFHFCVQGFEYRTRIQHFSHIIRTLIETSYVDRSLSKTDQKSGLFVVSFQFSCLSLVDKNRTETQNHSSAPNREQMVTLMFPSFLFRQ